MTNGATDVGAAQEHSFESAAEAGIAFPIELSCSETNLHSVTRDHPSLGGSAVSPKPPREHIDLLASLDSEAAHAADKARRAANRTKRARPRYQLPSRHDAL